MGRRMRRVMREMIEAFYLFVYACYVSFSVVLWQL